MYVRKAFAVTVLAVVVVLAASQTAHAGSATTSTTTYRPNTGPASVIAPDAPPMMILVFKAYGPILSYLAVMEGAYQLISRWPLQQTRMPWLRTHPISAMMTLAAVDTVGSVVATEWLSWDPSTEPMVEPLKSYTILAVYYQTVGMRLLARRDPAFNNAVQRAWAAISAVSRRRCII